MPLLEGYYMYLDGRAFLVTVTDEKHPIHSSRKLPLGMGMGYHDH